MSERQLVAALHETKPGPRLGPDGKMLARSLLGDPSDFEAMSREQTRVRSITPGSHNSKSDHEDNDNNPSFTTHLTEFDNSAKSKADTLRDSVQEGLDRELELRTALQVLADAKAKARADRTKKLKAMHIFQRFDEVRGPRTIARHEKRVAEWEAFRRRMAKKLNKDIDDLVISR